MNKKEQTMLNAIADTVRDKHGVSMGIAVYAALKIAAREWKDEDSERYGLMSKEHVNLIGTEAMNRKGDC